MRMKTVHNIKAINTIADLLIKTTIQVNFIGCMIHVIRFNSLLPTINALHEVYIRKCITFDPIGKD